MSNDKSVAALTEHRAHHLKAVYDTADLRDAIELALRSEAAIVLAGFDAEKADFEADRDAYIATFDERYDTAKASVEASIAAIPDVVDAILANTQHAGKKDKK